MSRPVSRELADHFGTVSTRTGERTVSTVLEVRDDLRDGAGALRMGVVSYGVDVATGQALGLAVVDQDLWVVTTDMDVHVVVPVVDGPLRIEAEVVRAGATTAVARFSLHDDRRGAAVGGGTVTCRPFPFDFDPAILQMPVGEVRRHGGPTTAPRRPLAEQLGLRPTEDGAVEIDIVDGVRNPWGILHGGATACLVDVAGEAAGSAALGRAGRVRSQLVRYLAPGRVGPARAEPRVLAVADDRALVEVSVVDTGAEGRLLAVATLSVG
jgi:uncharacterized protein (TIGR00369 family)